MESFSKVFWKVFFDQSFTFLTKKTKVFGKFLESFWKVFWKVFGKFWKVFGKFLERSRFFPTKFVIFPEVTEVTKFTEFGSAKGDCRSRECTNGNIASFLKHAKLVRVYSTVVVV